MLHATATVKVNALVWITSLEDADERQSTEQVLTFLEPLLQATKVPFVKVEPKTAAELFAGFDLLESRTPQESMCAEAAGACLIGNRRWGS